MATRQTSPSENHKCSCGETFTTTEDLVAHARSEHGLWAH
jgi:hypothetical protein